MRVRYSVTGRAPQVKVTGTIQYERSAERGVGSDFATEIPLEIQMPNGQRSIEWVRSGEQPEAFSFTLRQAPTRITVPANMTLASER